MITLTEKAVHAVKRIRGDEPGSAGARLRIRVLPGGCSGMNYKLDFDTQNPAPGELLFAQDGFEVVIDAKSHLFVDGMTIDFRDGLNGSGFVFNNPNAKQTCGCGESFSA
jgi:iron-sulfur cluster assembly protein